jgi:hypothetical protein
MEEKAFRIYAYVMIRKKTILLFSLFLSFALFFLIAATPLGKRLQAAIAPKRAAHYGFTDADLARIKTKAASAQAYAQKHQLNQAYCFLIDMSLPSGRSRFFVYDMNSDSILQKGLVTHGRCNEQWLEGRRYSNTVGSGCTSLGRYKTGVSYQGKFGLAYKLHGLDASNSNAFARYVVLHSHECVPESETAAEICQSDGCPTVAPQFLQQLNPLLKKSKQPFLLWIFE